MEILFAIVIIVEISIVMLPLLVAAFGLLSKVLSQMLRFSVMLGLALGYGIELLFRKFVVFSGLDEKLPFLQHGEPKNDQHSPSPA